MNAIAHFWHLWKARKLPTSALSSTKVGNTERMLRSLQQICAALPQGEAEVWLHTGRLQISLLWNPEEKSQETSGIYFLLNGQNEKVKYAEYEEENDLKVKAKTNSTREENSEKTNRQLNTLKKLLNYLQLHYAFRYNRLTDRTEYAVCSDIKTEGCKEDEQHELQYQPADNRALNSISLQVMQAGIPCWDRDIRRYVESADVPSYHPFTSYIENLPQWDGVDRVTPLARRVSDEEIWLNSFPSLDAGCHCSMDEHGRYAATCQQCGTTARQCAARLR